MSDILSMDPEQLGASYWSLAEVWDKETNLKLAIEAYREALKVSDAEGYPIYNLII